MDMKTKICVKCNEENYTDGDVCVIDGCLGALKEAKVFECKNCGATLWIKVIKVTSDNYPKCPTCDKSMVEYKEK